MKNGLRDDITVIDFGSHFIPEEIDTSDRGREPQHKQNVGIDRVHDPETQIAEMKEAGVDGMVHSVPTYLGHPDTERTADANDELFRYIDKYDEYYGVAGIPTPAGGDEAAAEFERCLDTGFHAGGIDETHVELVDDEMEPVFEVADQTGAPIFVHVPSVPDADYRFNAIYGRELSLSQSITQVIHQGIYDRYPDLKIVWHHLGGNIASKMGRLHLHTDPGRWMRQEEMKPFDELKRQFEERVYIDTAGYFGYSAPIRIALEEMPATQILFGTDYPWEPRSANELGKFADAVVEAGSYDDAVRILGQNAMEIMVNV